MKNIYKSLMIIAVLTLQVRMASSQTLDEMPQQQRDSVLIAIAKEVIMKFGSDYYREYQQPVIKRFVYPYTDVDQGKNQGRITYSVIISYDYSQEKLEKDYAVVVGIWSDTKEPHIIAFGDGWMRDIPTNWRTDTTIEPTPYKEIDISPIWDLDNPDNTEPKNKDELIRRGWERISDGEWVKTRPDLPPYKREKGNN